MMPEFPVFGDETEGPADDLVGYSIPRILDAYVPRRNVTFFTNLADMQGMFDDDVTDLSTTIRETLKAIHAGDPARPD